MFAEPTNADARELLAETFERLAHGAENATWRNCYLVGPAELRHGVRATDIATSGFLAGLTITQILDAIAVRVDGPRAWSERLSIDLHLTDLEERYRLELSNGVLVHFPEPDGDPADLTATLTKAQLLALLAGGGADGIRYEGDSGVLPRLLAVLDDPDPNFAVVTLNPAARRVGPAGHPAAVVAQDRQAQSMRCRRSACSAGLAVRARARASAARAWSGRPTARRSSARVAWNRW